MHGSSANVERFFAIVDAYRAQHDDAKVVLLGDIYNHGPRNPLPEGYAPMKVAERLNASKDYVTLIHGNCDSEVDQMITEFEIRPDFSLQWGERRLFFTHGHKCNPDLPCKDAKKRRRGVLRTFPQSGRLPNRRRDIRLRGRDRNAESRHRSLVRRRGRARNQRKIPCRRRRAFPL